MLEPLFLIGAPTPALFIHTAPAPILSASTKLWILQSHKHSPNPRALTQLMPAVPFLSPPKAP